MLAYFTDCGFLPFDFAGLTQILLEANYFEENLTKAVVNGAINLSQAERIKNNHLSVEQAAEWLKKQDLTKCKEIHLIHTSSRHADKKEVKDFIKNQIPHYDGLIL